jgi:hypothetical protein
MVVNAMNVIVAMENTINAEASIRQQKLSLLSISGKKGGDGRNHRLLLWLKSKNNNATLMMPDVGIKTSTFLASKMAWFE